MRGHFRDRRDRPSREVVSYWKRVERLLDKDSFDTEDSKTEFVDDVFKSELLVHPFRAATDVLCSRVVEKVSQEGTKNQRRALFSVFRGQYVRLLCDQYASHVVQYLLAEVVEDCNTGIDADCTSIMDSFREEVAQSLQSLLCDRYASHVLAVAGPFLKKEIQETVSPDVNSFALHRFASIVLQACPLEVVFNGGYQDDVDINSYIQELVRDRNGSRVMEAAIHAFGVDGSWFNSFVRPHVREFALHPVANFVLQTIIKGMKSDLEGWILEIVGSLPWEDLWGSERCRILLALGEATSSHSEVAQKAFLSKLKQVLGTTLFDGLLREQRVGIHMLSILVSKFSPTMVSDVYHDVAKMDGKSLQELACSKKGSLFVQMFLKGNAPEKLKQRVVRGISDFVTLAMNPHGSFVLQECFGMSTLDYKRKVVEELLKNEEAILSTVHGRHVLRYCQVDNYKRANESWESSFKQISERRKQILAAVEDDADDKGDDDIDAIFDGKRSSKKKKKKRKGKHEEQKDGKKRKKH